MKYRQRHGIEGNNPEIGCIILTEPFFFEKTTWIPVPEDWKKSIVQGKVYNTSTPIGKSLYNEVQERLHLDPEIRYSSYMTRHRLGQGAFRVSVADAYHRRCAITGEKTLPVLQAAHIKPYANEGPHLVSNGILLRSDLHTLYDDGYVTIEPDYRIRVSKRLHEDYGNGKAYYQYDGKHLLILPDSQINLPDRNYLEWHNEHVFLEN